MRALKLQNELSDDEPTDITALFVGVNKANVDDKVSGLAGGGHVRAFAAVRMCVCVCACV